MKIELSEAPIAGLVVTIGSQQYRLIGFDHHIKRDGQSTRLGVWKSECADCGKPFETRAPERQFPQSRRCDQHRAPGRKVAS